MAQGMAGDLLFELLEFLSPAILETVVHCPTQPLLAGTCSHTTSHAVSARVGTGRAHVHPEEAVRQEAPKAFLCYPLRPSGQVPTPRMPMKRRGNMI